MYGYGGRKWSLSFFLLSLSFFLLFLLSLSFSPQNKLSFSLVLYLFLSYCVSPSLSDTRIYMRTYGNACMNTYIYSPFSTQPSSRTRTRRYLGVVKEMTEAGYTIDYKDGDKEIHVQRHNIRTHQDKINSGLSLGVRTFSRFCSQICVACED